MASNCFWWVSMAFGDHKVWLRPSEAKHSLGLVFSVVNWIFYKNRVWKKTYLKEMLIYNKWSTVSPHNYLEIKTKSTIPDTEK